MIQQKNTNEEEDLLEEPLLKNKEQARDNLSARLKDHNFLFTKLTPLLKMITNLPRQIENDDLYPYIT